MTDPTSAGERPGTPLGSLAGLFSVLTVVTLGGCSAPGAGQPPPVKTFHLTEYRVAPAKLSLDAGSYTFTAVNDGTIGHALELSGNGIDGHTPDFAYGPGHSEGFTVTLKPGSYEFFCPVDGHRGLGMLGTLVVH